MQFHPFSVSSLVCCSEKGGSTSGGDEIKEKREGSWPLINLELEVGGGLAFTDAQFHELFLQVVIFKYLNSGLPVPFHLVLLIRKSIAISSACGFRSPLLVQGSTMDLEPGRCRRTDGKKWRCYGSVIPDQKYCERHMFRGSSQRSRKLVEASRNILKSNNSNREEDLLLPSDKKSRTAAASVTNGGFSVPVSTTLNLTPPSVIAAEAGKNKTRDESKWNDTSGNHNSLKSSVAAASGVSPKSVLQGANAIGIGNGNLSFDTEELRCRRTDGKRWRCSRMVVPSKKYCENHLHRGAKKAKSAAGAVTVVAGGSRMHKLEMVKKNYRVLDTNLSISVAASPRQVFDGDFTTTSTTSSSSDATTVSDENVYQFLHNF